MIAVVPVMSPAGGETVSQTTGNDCSLPVMSPAGGDKGVVGFNAFIIFISYALARLNPPPSLRDTSASGGYEMTFFAIATQSRMPGMPVCFRLAASLIL